MKSNESRSQFVILDQGTLSGNCLAQALTSKYPEYDVLRFSVNDDMLNHISQFRAALIFIELERQNKSSVMSLLAKIRSISIDEKVCLIFRESHYFQNELSTVPDSLKGRLNNENTMRDLELAIEKILSGKSYFTKGVQQECEVGSGFPKITKRQSQILNLLANGSSNKEIANILQISEATVKHHFNKVFKVLNTKNRTEALQEAIRLNIIGL